MHQIIQDGLEDYLSGTLEAASLARVEAHLAECAECKTEVSGMRELSGLFASLRVSEEEAVAPVPGFYAKLSNHIEQTGDSSIWSILFQPAFARQVALASLLFLAAVGGLLLSNEPEYPGMLTPETIMAVDEGAPQPPVGEETRAQMLVTLVSYE